VNKTYISRIKDWFTSESTNSTSTRGGVGENIFDETPNTEITEYIEDNEEING
jgi:hypothetical protein